VAANDAVPAVFEEPPSEETVVHRVKSGETLYSIAKKYQTTIDKLKSLNRLVGNTLRVGTRLVVSTPRSTIAQQQ
jgi:LysM repeat protein